MQSRPRQPQIIFEEYYMVNLAKTVFIILYANFLTNPLNSLV